MKLCFVAIFSWVFQKSLVKVCFATFFCVFFWASCVFYYEQNFVWLEMKFIFVEALFCNDFCVVKGQALFLCVCVCFAKGC